MTLVRRSSIFLSLSLLALAACTPVPTKPGTTHVRGNPNATIVVVEYGDLQCPACKTAHTIINAPLMAKYGNAIAFQFVHFPLKASHQYAYEAAQASECAGDQGKFWEFVDYTYENQKDLSSAALKTWAKALGLNSTQFDACVSSGDKADIVSQDMAYGRSLGVDSTPTYFVNGKHVDRNSLEALSAQIDPLLAPL